MEILAHRANIEGPNHSSENSLSACDKAIRAGFGLEIDLRKNRQGSFYISHDPGARTPENDLRAYQEIWEVNPALPMAVNVKELGYETDLIRLQEEGAFGKRDFYFDFELLEKETPGKNQRLLAGLPGGSSTRVASRLSDRGETLEQCLALPSYAVWADEFDSLWLTEAEIMAVKAAGRKLYVISPELHGFTREERLRRWADFAAWGIDGVCTDYALEARDFFGE